MRKESAPRSRLRDREYILAVDDERKILELVTRALEGRRVETAASAQEAREKLDGAALVLLDLKLGESDGMELLDEFRQIAPGVPVIVMTAFATVESSVAAMKRGAWHYITKPFASLDELRLLTDRALDESRLRTENARLRELLTVQDQFEEMIGGTAPMRKLYDMIARIADHDATVLITGESGTGKELVARAIHRRSSRRDRPFLEINCAAIPLTLLESELFGYEKGAFTGAYRTKKGLLETAGGGTILLDEIGDMPLELQAKLLRVLDERRFVRLGGSTPTLIDVRIIAATNRNLKEAVRKKLFREDLFFRLAVIQIDVPPLRSRRDDIVKLLAALMPDVIIEPEALERLVAYDWPGNIRELKNLTERVRGMGITRLTIEEVPSNIASPGAVVDIPGGSLTEQVEAFERQLLERALSQASGSRTQTAKALGVSRQVLQYKIDKYGLMGEE